jgi:Ca-activated chloride channel family protein
MILRRCLPALAVALLATAQPWLAAQGTLSPPQKPENVPAQTPHAHFKINVHLVNVFINVTDAHGAPVPNLTKSDFSLSQDGVPQKIAYFERQTNMPLSIVLAIDTSGSVYIDHSLEIRAARDFIHALMRPVDQMDLIDFNSSVDEIVPFTSDVRLLDRGLDHLTQGPATALYDAVWLSSQRLAGRHGRKVLVVISDGGNTISGIDYPQALDQALRDEVMIYSIIDVPIVADAGRDTGGEHALISLSQGTGGKYYYAEYGHLAEAFQQLSQDLRTQYLIGYYPAPRRTESDFRRIHVELRPGAVPNASADTLRYRPGYFAPPSPPLDQ